MKFIFFLTLIISCSKTNDPFTPDLNTWMHYQTEVYSENEYFMNYKFTFRFISKTEGIFFLEVNSYDEKRKIGEKLELHQAQIYGEMVLKDNKLKLKYTDSVVNHRYCPWVLSHIGIEESIEFFYNKSKNEIASKISGKNRVFYERKKKPIELKYVDVELKIDKEDCEFFTKTLGPEKGFFH